MRYLVRHTTSYDYDEPVSICHNEARLVPRKTEYQLPLSTRLLVEPTPPQLTSDSDYFGNVVHFFTLEEAHVRLAVSSISEVELTPFQMPVLSLSPPWESVRDRAQKDRSPDGLRAFEFTLDSPHVRRAENLLDYAAPCFAPGRPLLEAVYELTRRIHDDFKYEPGSTTIATPLDRVIETRRGVCQDFAHLEIGMLRSLGIPARYVSGYVQNSQPAGKPRLAGADASHAWLSAFCPGFGYVDFDPTNGSIPNDEHVTLAWGRDFSDTSPLRGVILGGGQHVVRVGVEVARA
jgi:transglutaminase-like putative cysteine protease